MPTPPGGTSPPPATFPSSKLSSTAPASELRWPRISPSHTQPVPHSSSTGRTTTSSTLCSAIIAPTSFPSICSFTSDSPWPSRSARCAPQNSSSPAQPLQTRPSSPQPSQNAPSNSQTPPSCLTSKPSPVF